MRTIIATFILASTLFLPTLAEAQNINAFQGLHWGANENKIKERFPQAIREKDSGEQYPICKNTDGTTRYCTISQQMCESMGRSCHPSLIIEKYKVGAYEFRTTFELSKSRKLNGVTLTYTGELTGKDRSNGRLLFEQMADSLSKKYGAPTRTEHYREEARSIGGFLRWQSPSSRINLNFFGKTNDAGEIQDATLTIIYSPLIDDLSSKL